jgi:hypothetical protein
MSNYAEPYHRKGAGMILGAWIERRVKIIPAFMIAAIAAIIVLALIAEARMPPEKRLELFETSYAYP